MSTKKGTNWGALGRFAQSLVMGDGEGALAVLSEEPQPDTVPAPAPDPSDLSKPCSAVDGECVCVGHTPDGVCIMQVKS